MSALVLTCAVAFPASAQSRGPSIRATLRVAMAGARRCAERSLAQGEQLDGRYVLEVHVERSGRVSHARVAGSDQRAPAFVRCVSRTIKRLRFGPQPRRIVIRYPITVDPQ